MRKDDACYRLLLAAAFLLLNVISVSPQTVDDDTASREITSLDFQRQRPKAASGALEANVGKTVVSGSAKSAEIKQQQNRQKMAAGPVTVVTNPKRRYALVRRIPPKRTAAASTTQAKRPGGNGPNVKTDENVPEQKTKSGPAKIGEKNSAKTDSKKNADYKTEEVGVTFWRLRPVKTTEEGDAALFPVKVNNRTENWTAERVNSTTKFNPGDRVRFTIESSRTGFLYIVNREVYADGTTGEAHIIFPTLRTRGGDNSVVAGSLIEIPASTDSVPYFTVKPRRPDYAGEELLIIISPIKLPLDIQLRALPLNREEVEKWLDRWQTIVDIYDAEDGEGIALTPTEADVANSQSRALTQEEPLPQTIYRVRAVPEQALLVPLRMLAAIP